MADADESGRPAGLRLYEFSAQALLLGMQTGSIREVVDGIPKGADLVDAGYIPERQVFYLTVEHPDFDAVHEGASIPQETITVHSPDVFSLLDKWEEYGDPADEACASELREEFDTL
jgi:hypothetical protein